MKAACWAVTEDRNVDHRGRPLLRSRQTTRLSCSPIGDVQTPRYSRSPRTSGGAAYEKFRSKYSLHAVRYSSISGGRSVSHTSFPVGMWRHLTAVTPSKGSWTPPGPGSGFRASGLEYIVTNANSPSIVTPT